MENPGATLQSGNRPADEIIVKRSFLETFIRQLAWLALAVTTSPAADPTGPIPVAARETTTTATATTAGVGVADVLVLRSKAEGGDVTAQMTLGEFFQVRQQHAEAVHWYRLAATNGEVTAQLALAGSLIAGRGTEVNRREAAYWMRLAADGVEQAVGVRPSGSSPRPAHGQPIILTRTNAVPGAVTSSASAAAGGAAKNLFTNDDARSTRATRDDNLSAVEPKLQQRSVGLQPPVTPK